MINENNDAKKTFRESPELSDCIRPIISKVDAPRIAGIDNSNENLAAAFLSKPSILPAVITIPALLVPGKKAKT